MDSIGNIPKSQLHKDWFLEREREIQKHPAWHGSITIHEAEELLKGQSSFTYLLRAAENSHQFFLSFVLPDTNIHHQIFDIEQTLNGWSYRNGDPHTTQTLSSLIPMIMHCSEKECISLPN